MRGYEKWQAFEMARGSKQMVIVMLASKTLECSNVKDTVSKHSLVIHNQIVLMQHKDVKINGLKQCLDKDIHSKKTHGGMI